MKKPMYDIFAYGSDKPEFVVDADGVDRDGDQMMSADELTHCKRRLFAPSDFVGIDGGYTVRLHKAGAK